MEKRAEKGTQLCKFFFPLWLGKVHEAQIDAIVLIFGPLSSLKTQPWSELFPWDHFWDLKEAWHGW